MSVFTDHKRCITAFGLVSMKDFLEKAGSHLLTLRGLIYTNKDLFEFGCVVTEAEKYQIVYGSDEVSVTAVVPVKPFWCGTMQFSFS